MTAQCFAGLLEAAQRGDEEAFRALFRSVQPGLLRCLEVLAGPLAEDIAADTGAEISTLASGGKSQAGQHGITSEPGSQGTTHKPSGAGSTGATTSGSHRP